MSPGSVSTSDSSPLDPPETSFNYHPSMTFINDADDDADDDDADADADADDADDEQE